MNYVQKHYSEIRHHNQIHKLKEYITCRNLKKLNCIEVVFLVTKKFSHKMLQRNTFIVKVFVSENSILYATDIPNFFIYEKSFWSIDKKGIISEINLIPQLDIMIKKYTPHSSYLSCVSLSKFFYFDMFAYIPFEL